MEDILESLTMHGKYFRLYICSYVVRLSCGNSCRRASSLYQLFGQVICTLGYLQDMLLLLLFLCLHTDGEMGWLHGVRYRHPLPVPNVLIAQLVVE